MITPDWVRTMARYNAWQNEWLIPAIRGLSEAEAERHRGAFFWSIRKTASHLLWGDEVWLSRFVDEPIDGGGTAGSVDWVGNVATWADKRTVVDARIIDWAENLQSCEGELTWWSGALGRQANRSKSVLYTHFFNHQTHHRGQMHAMLTAAGAHPSDTDLFMLEGLT